MRGGFAVTAVCYVTAAVFWGQPCAQELAPASPVSRSTGSVDRSHIRAIPLRDVPPALPQPRIGEPAVSSDSGWTVHTAREGKLPTDDVQCLLHDRAGRLWAGTELGLVRYDGVTWKTFTKDNSPLPVDNILSLCEDAHGALWIGTYGGGVVRLAGRTWTVYSRSNSGLPGNYVWCLLQARDGYVVAGVLGRGLAGFDGISWDVLDTSNSELPTNIVSCMLQDRIHGRFWIGTRGPGSVAGGLVEYDGRVWQRHSIDGSVLEYAECIVEDGAGNVWVGTWGKGLATYNGSSWTVFTNANSALPSDYVWSVRPAVGGGVWIGTMSGGLSRFDGAGWHEYTMGNSGLSSQQIRCLAVDPRGELWVGTINGGLVQATAAAFSPRRRLAHSVRPMGGQSLLGIPQSSGPRGPTHDAATSTSAGARGVDDDAVVCQLVDFHRQAMYVVSCGLTEPGGLLPEATGTRAAVLTQGATVRSAARYVAAPRAVQEW